MREHGGIIDKLASAVCLFLFLPLFSELVYIRQGNAFQHYFTEPIETIVIIFDDGKYFTFSITEEFRTGISVTWLAKHGYPISRAIIIIHNHLDLVGFSPRDIETYWALYREGFRGTFLLYLITGKVIPFKRSLPTEKK
jgi:hypothetical protein